MLRQFTLTPIAAVSKGEVKRLRLAGFVPISLQHKGMETQHYQVESEPFDAFIHKYGDAALIDLVIAPDDHKQRAILKTITRHPVTHKLQQVTLQQIRHDDTLKTHVSLMFTGEPSAVVTSGAMVQHALDMLDIECPQDSLPKHITVYVGDMEIGDVIRVSDLKIDPRYKVMAPADTVLASLTANRVNMPDAEDEAAAASGETE